MLRILACHIKLIIRCRLYTVCTVAVIKAVLSPAQRIIKNAFSFSNYSAHLSVIV